MEIWKNIHSICGLAQSARQHCLKFVAKLRKLGFTGGHPDLCLMTRKNENGICFIAIWADDLLLVGHPKAIQQTIEDLKREGFNLKLDGSLDDCLSCEIAFDEAAMWGGFINPICL